MLTLLAAAALAATPVADDQVLQNDLRCVAALASLGDVADKEDADGIAAVMLYFLGKVDARAPGIDLMAGIEKVLAEPAYNGPTEAVRCAGELSARADALDAIESALKSKPAS